MTTDPVRLLAQDDDAFSSSLLKAGRDGDAAAARARKVAVLGAAAGGAALGGAALLGAKVASKGVWATFTGKWLAVFAIVAGGAGVTAAVLLSGDGGGPANDGAAAAVAAPVEAQPAAKPSEPAPGSEPARGAEPAAPSEPALVDPPAPIAAEPAAAPAIPPPSDPAAKAAAASVPRSGEAAEEPAPAVKSAPAPAGSSAAPAPSDAASELAEEVAAIRAAREALGRGQAQKCLEAVNAYFARFPKGHLSAEARLLRIEAMAASGQRDQAAAQARALLAANPHSPYAPRLRAIAGESASP